MQTIRQRATDSCANFADDPRSGHAPARRVNQKRLSSRSRYSSSTGGRIVLTEAAAQLLQDLARALHVDLVGHLHARAGICGHRCAVGGRPIGSSSPGLPVDAVARRASAAASAGPSRGAPWRNCSSARASCPSRRRGRLAQRPLGALHGLARAVELRRAFMPNSRMPRCSGPACRAARAGGRPVRRAHALALALPWP